MRKGIVMEQNKKFTIVMVDDGTFHKAKRLKRANVGMEVHFQSFKDSSMKDLFLVHRMKLAAVAMAILLTLFPAYFWHEDNKAYAFVNVDINPSVEMEVNGKMKVLKLNPLNDEAEEMITRMTDWKKQPASEVALQMISLSQQQGYMNRDQEVLIGVSYLKDKDSDFSSEIENYLHDEMEGLMLASYNVPNKVRKQAEDEETSVNELMAESIGEDAEESEEQEGESIEDDDLAIIQSFYEENKSSDNDKEPGSSNEEPVEEELMLPHQKFNRSKPDQQEIHPVPNQDKGEKEVENSTPHREKEPDHPSNEKGKNGDAKGGNSAGQQNFEKKKSKNDTEKPSENNSDKSREKDAARSEDRGNKEKDKDHPSQKNKNSNKNDHKGKPDHKGNPN
ncbi:anti-sigma factor domain-containing protein [Halobacillus sp. A5]|uniref:anti-sigma factor domain-containing protein n=1 Tax=Halobacillus sp. A5 TaxID=2880263 RepID=UPI0020A68EAF|nr:anti-sigma factor domain-containing protein [Halobacillus sp. A5]MCP3026816.1 anti-sigma factor domain-containing protein [Halobacillus sp. A5]